jgi:hypothetical protein
MAIVKNIPSKRIINGFAIETSDSAVVTEKDYKVNGEAVIVVRGVPSATLTLDSMTSDHVVVKSMTNLKVKPDINRIDEEYDEVDLDKFACVEFKFIRDTWYILSSDGLKNS